MREIENEKAELPPLPKELVLVDMNDDGTWGELQEHAWDSDYGKDLTLNAPLFTEGQMRDYALAAIESRASAAPQQEPVAWMFRNLTTGKTGFLAEEPQAATGYEFTPLYAAPGGAPAQQVEAEKWISATERLPAEPGQYLVNSTRGVRVAVRHDPKWANCFQDMATGDDEGMGWADLPTFRVTHWMELPKPPSAGSNNGEIA